MTINAWGIHQYMATNKNQHFVPRCYLRPFSIDSANVAINLFNIDRKKFIEFAAVKHQCSKSYFYGEDLLLEKALQPMEGLYASVLKEVLAPGYRLTDVHRDFFRQFWLLQYVRTEAASRRAVEMNEEMGEVIGLEADEFRLSINDAVQMAMRTFVEKMHAVDDLKVCLIRNRTKTPFFTSDDPAVLTNKWHLKDRRTKRISFGLQSAGNILLLPLSPTVLCLGYDGHVYSVPNRHGWVDVRHNVDICAINEHQFLNCRANIFVRDAAHAQIVQDTFASVEPRRPVSRHVINYAVLDQDEKDYKRYQVVDRDEAGDHREALVHSQTIHGQPSVWPRQIRWRERGFVYTDGSAAGYVRRALVETRPLDGFRKELAR